MRKYEKIDYIMVYHTFISIGVKWQPSKMSMMNDHNSPGWLGKFGGILKFLSSMFPISRMYNISLLYLFGITG